MNFIPFPIILLCSIAYRMRGGGYFTFGSDVPCRLIWGAALALAYAALSWPNVDLFYAVALPLLGYASMMVPHGFAQNMGRWATPQKKWPSFFLPTLTDSEWTALPFWLRTVYDFFGMAGVAAFRALIVFLPSLGLSYLEGRQIEPTGVLRAFGVLVIGQPLGYVIGWYVPFSIGKSLTKYSTEWGEFINGAVWALALAVL